jgi:hypothetical protein
LALVVVLGAGSVAACASVLGLDAPILCEGGNCPDATGPDIDASGSSSGGDSSDSPHDVASESPFDAGAEAMEADATPSQDAAPDAAPDAGGGADAAQNGVQCGPVYCDYPKSCCITTSGSPSFVCVADAGLCKGSSEFPVQCSSSDPARNPCFSDEVCCFFGTKISCAAPGCNGGGSGTVVCDPNDPGFSCDAGQTCTAGILKPSSSGYILPYSACK